MGIQFLLIQPHYLQHLERPMPLHQIIVDFLKIMEIKEQHFIQDQVMFLQGVLLYLVQDQVLFIRFCIQKMENLLLEQV